MGNYFQSKETESDEFKEPKMADEKLEIPKDTPENLENKEEPKQAKIEKEEVEISNENPEEEEHKSNEKEEEDIHNEEQNEEQNEDKKEEQNEEKQDEEDEVLKTPIKNRTYDPAENNKVLQHNDDIQRNKIIIESSLDQHHEARPINQMNQRENAENQEINESYELNPEQNANNEKNANKIVYHNIAFRSGKKQNNFDLNKNQKEQFVKKEIYKFKNASNITKEPKDSNPKVIILSDKKKGNKKYIKENKKKKDRIEKQRKLINKKIKKVENLWNDEYNKIEYLKRRINILNKKHRSENKIRNIKIKNDFFTTIKKSSDNSDNPLNKGFLPKLLEKKKKFINEMKVGELKQKKKITGFQKL